MQKRYIPYRGDQARVFPDDDFWHIVENMDSLDDLDEPLDEKRIEEVLKQVQLTDDDLDDLIAAGKVPPEDRNKIREDADAQTANFYDRATRVVWQLSCGQVRSEYVYEDRVLYDAFSLLDLDPDDMDDLIHVPVEGGYHRSIFIRRSEIDYVFRYRHTNFRRDRLKRSKKYSTDDEYPFRPARSRMPPARRQAA